ncbi:MAG: response regulator [Zetaproteobacteria bacterium]|nr:response regulator [Zetaproteobacteria bacterium]
MTVILIVDSFKPSVVMTSEICKDRLLGVRVVVASSGAETLEAVSRQPFDLIIVDFDLPDVDGPTLIRHLRGVYTGPVLMTAYPEKIVEVAVAEELFAFNDASGWIRKPIKAEDLQEKVQFFLTEGKRIYRRFDVQMPATIKVANEKKNAKTRTTAIKAKLVNLGLGGILVEVPEGSKMKKGESVAVQLNLEEMGPLVVNKVEKTAVTKAKVMKKVVGSKKKVLAQHAKKSDLDSFPKSLNRIKAHVVWSDADKGCAGLYFDRLTKSHVQTLNRVLRFVYANEAFTVS